MQHCHISSAPWFLPPARAEGQFAQPVTVLCLSHWLTRMGRVRHTGEQWELLARSGSCRGWHSLFTSCRFHLRSRCLACLRTTFCCSQPSHTASVECGAPPTALACSRVGEIYLPKSFFLVFLFGTLKAWVQWDGELPLCLMLSFSPHEVVFNPSRDPLDLQSCILS